MALKVLSNQNPKEEAIILGWSPNKVRKIQTVWIVPYPQAQAPTSTTTAMTTTSCCSFATFVSPSFHLWAKSHVQTTELNFATQRSAFLTPLAVEPTWRKLLRFRKPAELKEMCQLDNEVFVFGLFRNRSN